jgi:integrative and conjugative element protein (TIGR02256 family)
VSRVPWRCWIRDVALSDLHSEARRWQLRETGGALLGWHENGAYVIDRMLGPGPKAKHGFASFEPDSEWQAREGARIYHDTGRTVAYIGDWHTHPHGNPYPSGQDRRTVEAIANDTDFRIQNPLYAILGRSLRDIRARRWRLVMYVWNGESLEPIEVDIL